MYIHVIVILWATLLLPSRTWMNLLRKGTFARNMFIQRKSFIYNTQLCTSTNRRFQQQIKIIQRHQLSIIRRLGAVGIWRRSVCMCSILQTSVVLPCSSGSPPIWLQRCTEFSQLLLRNDGGRTIHPDTPSSVPSSSSSSSARTLCLASSSCKNNQ